MQKREKEIPNTGSIVVRTFRKLVGVEDVYALIIARALQSLLHSLFALSLKTTQSKQVLAIVS